MSRGDGKGGGCGAECAGIVTRTPVRVTSAASAIPVWRAAARVMLAAGGSLSDSTTGRSAGGNGVRVTGVNPVTTEGTATREVPCISAAGKDQAFVSGYQLLGKELRRGRRHVLMRVCVL